MLRKQKDEWGVVIQKQAEMNKIREMEEKMQAQYERERYRQDLEQQAQYREQKKLEELRQKEAEALIIREQALAFQQEELKKRQIQSDFQKNLAEEYVNQHTSIKNRQNLELQNKLREEQQLILYNKMLLEEESRKKKMQREKLHQDDLEMLNYKNFKEKNKKIEAQNELVSDLDLMRKRREAEERKEKEYRDYYEKIQKNQSMKQNLYSQQVGKQLLGKDLEINNWVNKNIDEYNMTIEEKMNKEKKIKQNNLENVKETLRYQLEEKNRVEQMKLEEQRRITEEVQRKIDENKRIEQEKEKNRRLQQALYYNHLHNQSLEKNDIKNSFYKMTEIEKKLNKNLSIEVPNSRNNFSIGAQEILKPNLRANSIFDLANASPNLMNKGKNNSESYIRSRPFEGLTSPKNDNRVLRPGGIFN